MRVIFMGTPDFAVGTFAALAEAGHEIVLAVTQPDKPRGRGKSMQYSPVKAEALSRGIEVYQPRRVREPECAKHLRSFRPDIIVVAAFGQILPKEILGLPPYGCINVHASLLPKYRGAAPVQWAVINGETVTGVTTMRMDEGLDTGDMIMKAEVTLNPEETGGSLFDRLSEAGAKLCVRTLEEIEAGTAVYTRQDDAQATYTKMIKKEFGNIDWSRPAAEIERLVRGLDPWPSAYTKLRGKTFKIWRAEAVSDGDICADSCGDKKPDDSAEASRMAVKESDSQKEPGTILQADKRGILVQTGCGLLLLKEVQLEGKKRMAADAFLRGFQLSDGELLE